LIMRAAKSASEDARYTPPRPLSALGAENIEARECITAEIRADDALLRAGYCGSIAFAYAEIRALHECEMCARKERVLLAPRRPRCGRRRGGALPPGCRCCRARLQILAVQNFIAR
jgi:hypothetical protein